MVDGEGRKVCVGGGKEAGGKEREEGGEERSGVQETTGMCRMAGGWPGERTEKKCDCGGVKEQQVMGGLRRKCVGSTTSVLRIKLLVEISELPNVKHVAAFEKVKRLSCQQYKTVLVQANENKER